MRPYKFKYELQRKRYTEVAFEWFCFCAGIGTLYIFAFVVLGIGR